MTNKLLLSAFGATLAVGAFAQAPVLNYVKQIQPGNLASQHIACVAVDGSTLYVAGFRNGASGPINVTRVDNWTTSNATVAWTMQPARGVSPDNQTGSRDTDITVTANELLVAGSLGDSTNKCVYRIDKSTGALLTLGTLDPFNAGYMLGSAWSSNNFQKIGIDNGFSGGGPQTLAAMLLASSSLNRASLPGGVAQGVVAGITGCVDLNGNVVVRPVNMRDFVVATGGDTYTRVDGGTAGAPSGIYVNTRTTTNSFSANVIRRAIVPITGAAVQFLNMEYLPSDGSHDPFFVINNKNNANPNRFETWSFGSPGADGSMIASYDGGAEGNSVNGRPWRYESNLQNFSWVDHVDAPFTTRYLFVTGFKADDSSANPSRLTKQTVDIYQLGEEGKISLNVNLNNYDGTLTGGRTVSIQVQDPGTNAVLDARTLVTPTGSPASGSITFYTMARNYVRITAKVNGFLRDSFLAYLGAGPVSGTLPLNTGDCDNSGEIDAADIDLVIATFGELPTVGDTAPTDCDGSGEVDAADIDLVIANFGLLDN